MLEVDLIRVKGKTAPEQVFTLVGDGAVRKSAEFEALAGTHAEMIERYRAQDWTGAEHALGASRAPAQALGLGGLYDLYAERIATFRVEPPAPDWAGIYIALSK